MKKREADFSIVFRHWVLANPKRLPRACTFEIKQTRLNIFMFNSVEDHQLVYSEAIRHGKKGVLMRMQGVNGEPDYCYYREQPAYFVIKYPGVFHIISYDNFIEEKTHSHRKSLTSERASEISVISIPLK